MKINAIRTCYRENQCNTFCLDFPFNFTLVILLAFIVNILCFQITIYGIPVLRYFSYGYAAEIFLIKYYVDQPSQKKAHDPCPSVR